MKQPVFAVGVALAVMTNVSVYAASIDVSTFDIGSFNSLTANGGTVEDFESYSVGTWNDSTVTRVGTFRAVGGTGSGSTCNTLGGDCGSLFLSNQDVNGQGNISPQGGTNALQANDTYGMIWDVSQNGHQFDQIVFGIRDAADSGATLSITAEWTNASGVLTSVTKDLSQLGNNNRQLVAIDLGGLVSDAQITLSNNGRNNDSFTIDAASTVSTVPIPAALPLFLSALAGLGFIGFRRRNA